MNFEKKCLELFMEREELLKEIKSLQEENKSMSKRLSRKVRSV